MLNDRLQKLIIEGKGIFKTFVVGGSEKTIINVPEDRFVIITNLVYMGPSPTKMFNGDPIEALTKANTQIKIFSTKSYNQFMFRDQFSIVELASGDTWWLPFGQTNINTFLIHESDISFTFSKCGESASITTAVTPSIGIAYPSPFDYGKTGQPGPIATRQVSNSVLGVTPKESVGGGNDFIRVGQPQEQQFNFPVDVNTQYNLLDDSATYPILNVQYVEIKGIPANLTGSY